MKKILVSVMLPVYNTSKYLKRCLDSVINQTYKNLEIILVDDGSTDDSGTICDEYAKKDKRIKVIHKENGGLSTARNAGIEAATGDYYSFIDSDDIVDLNFIERMLNNCIYNNCEISICNYKFVFNNKEIFEKRILEHKVLNSKDALEFIFLNGNFVTWNKLYKKEVFEDIRFPVGKIFANIRVIPFTVIKSHNVYLDPYFGYYYYQNNGSILNSKDDLKKMDFVYNNIYMYDCLIKTYPYLKDAMDINYLRCLTSSILTFYNKRKKYQKEYNFIFNELKKYKKIYLKNKYITKKLKIKIFMIFNHMVWLIIFVSKIKNIRKLFS